eukprot:196460-Pleurochrysis_carterae.AAC.1
MFQKQGMISAATYLNDELRFVLPHDNHVRIRENSTNYTVTLVAADTFVYAVTGENDTVERATRGQIGQFDGQ